MKQVILTGFATTHSHNNTQADQQLGQIDKKMDIYMYCKSEKHAVPILQIGREIDISTDI